MCFPSVASQQASAERHRPAVYLAALAQMGMVHQRQIMVRKQHNHLQTKMRFDMTAAALSALHCRAARHVIAINPFLASFCGPSHFCQLSAGAALLVSLDYDWLCPSINLPRQTWTSPQSLSRGSADVFFISPGDSTVWLLLRCFLGMDTWHTVKLDCYSKLAIILHFFWFSNSWNALRSVLMIYIWQQLKGCSYHRGNKQK